MGVCLGPNKDHLISYLLTYLRVMMLLLLQMFYPPIPAGADLCKGPNGHDGGGGGGGGGPGPTGPGHSFKTASGGQLSLITFGFDFYDLGLKHAWSLDCDN